MITASTPLLFAATGELMAEKAGVLNLGVEGMMLIGAVFAFADRELHRQRAAGDRSSGALAGALMALIFAFLTLTLLANQVATGLALTIFGIGFSALARRRLRRLCARAPAAARDPRPLDLPVVGPLALRPRSPGLPLALHGRRRDAWFLTKHTAPG